MRVEPLAVDGAFRLATEPHRDVRGEFARLWDADVLQAFGGDATVRQISRSTNPTAGTLRGLHWQTAPFVETRVVTCVAGRAWDVVADVRSESPTYGRWDAVELGVDGTAVFVPPGAAHGFLTLDEDTTLVYVISVPFDAPSSLGVRWDDPTLAIDWPLAPTTISERDKNLPFLTVG